MKGVPSLVFDTNVLAYGRRDVVSRGGIYRYASQLLIALEQSGCKQSWPHQLRPVCTNTLLASSADEELRELQERHNVQLYVPSASQKRQFFHAPTPHPFIKSLLRPLYRQFMNSSWMKEKMKLDIGALLVGVDPKNSIYHTPYQSIPDSIRSYGLSNVAVTLYDMLPRIHPEFFTREQILQFDFLLNKLQKGDHLICISESTRHDFLSSYPATPKDHVHVIPLAAAPGLQPVYDPAKHANLRAQLGLDPGDQIVLSLCTLEPRKNLKTLIAAFEQLYLHSDGSSIKLVLAGAMGWKNNPLREQLRSSPAAAAIVVSGHISESQLSCLYSMSDVFVYPSVYEGFGLPPLEAMQCGAPVIVGNHSSLPEVVGNAAVLVDPQSVNELGQAIANLLISSQNRNERRLRSLAQSANFSWARTAELTTSLYQTMLERSG